MRKLLGTIGLVLVLAACGESIEYKQIKTPDGRKVDCVVRYSDGEYSSQMSCDWGSNK